MEFTGNIKNINKDIITNDVNITFSCNEKNAIFPEYEKLKDSKKLSIQVKNYRKKRSINANGYLWTLLGKMAAVLRTDKWDIYLVMIKRYGESKYIVVEESAIDLAKREWREFEVLGEIDINGKKGIQLLYYFGSSNYNTEEMARLVDGVVSECKELDIETLPPGEIQKIKEQWGVDIEKVN